MFAMIFTGHCDAGHCGVELAAFHPIGAAGHVLPGREPKAAVGARANVTEAHETAISAERPTVAELHLTI